MFGTPSNQYFGFFRKLQDKVPLFLEHITQKVKVLRP